MKSNNGHSLWAKAWRLWRRPLAAIGPALRVIIAKPFSALALVERDAEAKARHADGATWYQLEPGRVYPAILRHIEEVLDPRDPAAIPGGAPDGALVPLWNAAQRPPREAWQGARGPQHKGPA